MRGTKHSRRARELGRMMFYAKELPCLVLEVFVEVFPEIYRTGALVPGPCSDVGQVAHIGGKAKNGGWRRCDDVDTVTACTNHHDDIDGRSGRRRREWFVALGRDNQRLFLRRLRDRASEHWDALTPNERQAWNELADLQRRGVDIDVSFRSAA